MRPAITFLNIQLSNSREINDMEAGRCHTVDDALQIIKDRMKREL